MSQSSSFRISLRPDNSTDYGYMVNSNQDLHKLLTEITERVIGIVRTSIATQGLGDLLRDWARHWGVQLSTNDSKQLLAGFRYLLERALTVHLKWPLMVIDWTMREEHEAGFMTVPDAARSEDGHYALEHNRIHLTGLRVHLIVRDKRQDNQEWRVRMGEMVWACCHELAHFFISYLVYQTGIQGDRRSPPDDENSEGKAEAGDTLERLVFGGYYVRGLDTSQRERKFMPGIPLLELDEDNYAIPFRWVNNLVTKNYRTSPYNDNDLVIPEEEIDERATDLRQRYSYFFTEFEHMFGVTYSAPGNYHDNQIRSSADDHQMSNVLARSTHPELTTFHHHRKVRLCKYSKSLLRGDPRDRGSSRGHDRPPSKDRSSSRDGSSSRGKSHKMYPSGDRSSARNQESSSRDQKSSSTGGERSSRGPGYSSAVRPSSGLRQQPAGRGGSISATAKPSRRDDRLHPESKGSNKSYQAPLKSPSRPTRSVRGSDRSHEEPRMSSGRIEKLWGQEPYNDPQSMHSDPRGPPKAKKSSGPGLGQHDSQERRRGLPSSNQKLAYR